MGKGPPSQRWKRARNRAQKGKHTSRPMLPVDVNLDLSKLGGDGDTVSAVTVAVAGGSSSSVVDLPQPQPAINGGVIHDISGAEVVECEGVDGGDNDISSKVNSHDAVANGNHGGVSKKETQQLTDEDNNSTMMLSSSSSSSPKPTPASGVTDGGASKNKTQKLAKMVVSLPSCGASKNYNNTLVVSSASRKAVSGCGANGGIASKSNAMVSSSCSARKPALAEVGELCNDASLFEIESQLSEVSESSCNNNNIIGTTENKNKKLLVNPGEKIHYGAVYYGGDGDKYSGVGYRPYRVVGRKGSQGVLWIPATEPVWTIKKNLRDMGFYLPDELAHVVFMYY